MSAEVGTVEQLRQELAGARAELAATRVPVSSPGGS